MVFRSADDDRSMHRSSKTLRHESSNINRHCWQVDRVRFVFFSWSFHGFFSLFASGSVSGVTCPVPKVDYDRRFRVKLFAPLLTTFEVFAQQLASYLGASSASTIRQFQPTSTIVPSTELFIEHVENRTVLTMQFDERWRRASLNSSLGIESVIDYELHLASTTSTRSSVSSSSSSTTLHTTSTTIISNASSLSSTTSSQSTTEPLARSGNNNMTTVVIVVIVVLVVLLFVGIAIVFKVLVFPRAFSASKWIDCYGFPIAINSLTSIAKQSQRNNQQRETVKTRTTRRTNPSKWRISNKMRRRRIAWFRRRRVSNKILLTASLRRLQHASIEVLVNKLQCKHICVAK
jgi:hypothetical protein